MYLPDLSILRGKDLRLTLTRGPAVRGMAGDALLDASMHGLGIQNFARMTSEAVFVYRLDAGMGFMALVAVQPGHGNLIRE